MLGHADFAPKLTRNFNFHIFAACGALIYKRERDGLVDVDISRNWTRYDMVLDFFRYTGIFKGDITDLFVELESSSG